MTHPLLSSNEPPGQLEWLRVTLASIGDAVITTDTDTRVVFMNPVAQNLTGWSQEDAIGRPLAEILKLIDEESRQTLESPAGRVLLEGISVGMSRHTALVAKDGTERPIDDCTAPIRSADGRIAGIVLIFRDITERRRREREMRSALRYSDNVIATMRDPFIVLDENLRIKSANPAFYECFKVTKEETEGRPLRDLGNAQWDILRLRTLLEETLSKDEPIRDFEMEADFPGIGKRTMMLNANRFQAGEHQPNLILVVFEDVSDRRRVEGGVHASEIRYRRLFESAKDGILMLDADTLRITDANPFMTELLGYSQDEFMGKELWEIGFFGDKQASQAAYEELRARNYVRYDHLPLQTRDGRRAEVEFVSNIYQSDGRSVAQCNIRDISERCRLERKTQSQAEELVDLHRRKDEFLAMLSHELRNPLAPLSNAVHMLRLQDSQDPLQKRACDIIDRQVSQMTHLVDDLMEVSRIVTGRIHLKQERIDGNGVVERAVESTRALIEARKHEMTVSLAPEAVWLYADPRRLEQVMVNLLSNAAKYTDVGGHIWVTVEHAGDECVLRVRDTGVGISPQLAPRIFDLFTQAERSLDRSQGGLGIGLALVRRLVEMHGGKTEIYSTLGKDSEFVVRLPTVASASLPPVVPSKEPEKMATSPLRVLVVDDSVDAADSLALLVNTRGHDVRTAYDGPETLKAVTEYRPDVVVLDIGLPGIDGYEVATRIRQQPDLKDIVLVAMTGYGLESDRQRAIDAGFDHHLVKPADFARLEQILSTVTAHAV